MADPGANRAVDVFLRDRERLIAAACRIVENRAVAEELVQDSWVRWHERDYPIEGAAPIFWRIVRNLALDWSRRSQTERRFLASCGPTQDLVPDSEEVVGARQDLRRVVAALDALPERTVRAFRLHRIEGYSYKAVGQEMGISPSTAFKLTEDAMVQIVFSLRG